MIIPQEFDYDQPGRDALIGVYVEVSDSAPGASAAEVPASQEKSVAHEAERLFADARPERVFHLAAEVLGVADDPVFVHERVPF